MSPHPSCRFLVRSLPAVCLLAHVLMATGVWAGEPEALIDTKFDKANSDGTLAFGAGSPPLEVPNAVLPAKASSSSVTSGKEAMGTLKPPYALFKIGARAGNSDAAEAASVKWNLVSLSILSGRYELTAKITPLVEDVTGGRLLVGLGSEGGKPLKLGVHPSDWPMQFYMAGKKMMLGHKSRPLNIGETVAVRIQFDLDKRVWSGWLNDDELLSASPFPPQLADTSVPLQVTNISFGSTSGMGDRAGATYAITDLKLVKIGD